MCLRLFHGLWYIRGHILHLLIIVFPLFFIILVIILPLWDQSEGLYLHSSIIGLLKGLFLIEYLRYELIESHIFNDRLVIIDDNLLKLIVDVY